MRVYIVVDTLGTVPFIHQFPPLSSFIFARNEILPSKYGFPDISKLKNLDLRLKTYHRNIFGAIHQKSMIIDGKISLFGSKNFEKDPCEEIVVRVDGPLALSIRVDIEALWGEDLPKLENDSLSNLKHPDDIPLFLMGRTETSQIMTLDETNPQDAGFKKIFEIAEKELYIHTLALNDRNVVGYVLDAVKRGVSVTLIEAYSYTDALYSLHPLTLGKNRDTVAKMYKMLRNDAEATKRLRVCWWMGSRRKSIPIPMDNEWTHVKAMIIDREIAVIGSANHDPISWHSQREMNVVFDDKETAQKLYSILTNNQISLDNCYHGV